MNKSLCLSEQTRMQRIKPTATEGSDTLSNCACKRNKRKRSSLLRVIEYTRQHFPRFGRLHLVVLFNSKWLQADKFEEQCLLMCFRVSMYTRCLCIDDGATKKNKYYTRQHTMPEKYRDTSGIRKFFRHVHVGVAFHTATRTFFPSLAVRNIYKICFALRLSKLTIP